MLALALWGFIAQQKPDWILDLHEGHDFNRSHNPPKGKKKSVGSSIIYDNTPELDCLARRMIAAADETVTDPEKKFMLIPRCPVNTGLARACINRFGANGLILETTFKNQPLSLRTLQHRSMVSVFLQHVGLINEDCRDVVGPIRN